MSVSCFSILLTWVPSTPLPTGSEIQKNCHFACFVVSSKASEGVKDWVVCGWLGGGWRRGPFGP